MDPTNTRTLGTSGVTVTELGFGGASIGELFVRVSEHDALATIDLAWDAGVRYFDTAPLYGRGLSELRTGSGLRDHVRAEYALSTKVGRLVRDEASIPPGTDIDRQELDGREDAYYLRTRPVRLVLDYSADGVRRSLEESLARLGLDRVDIALIHDPDDHWRAAIEEAARVAAGVLAECPGVRVLATSREVLHLDGESRLVVAPLAVPAAGADAGDKFDALERPLEPEIEVHADHPPCSRGGVPRTGARACRAFGPAEPPSRVPDTSMHEHGIAFPCRVQCAPGAGRTDRCPDRRESRSGNRRSRTDSDTRRSSRRPPAGWRSRGRCRSRRRCR